MIEIILSHRVVIILGVAAAALVTTGSLFRIRQKEGYRKMAAFCIYVGYVFFALSMLLYMVIGFR